MGQQTATFLPISSSLPLPNSYSGTLLEYLSVAKHPQQRSYCTNPAWVKKKKKNWFQSGAFHSSERIKLNLCLQWGHLRTRIQLQMLFSLNSSQLIRIPADGWLQPSDRYECFICGCLGIEENFLEIHYARGSFPLSAPNRFWLLWVIEKRKNRCKYLIWLMCSHTLKLGRILCEFLPLKFTSTE